jgi:hypothetical protein
MVRKGGLADPYRPYANHIATVVASAMLTTDGHVDHIGEARNWFRRTAKPIEILKGKFYSHLF